MAATKKTTSNTVGSPRAPGAPDRSAPAVTINESDAMSTVATVGLAVVGAAFIEAAFIPAILIGAAAALAPKFLPGVGQSVQPLLDSTVRGAVKMGRKAKTVVGDARERVGDISAEVAAEEIAEATV